MKRKKLVPWKKALLACIAFLFIFFGSLLVWASFIRLPDISTFEARKIANSSKITDRTGEIVLYDIHQSVRRTEIPLEEMGQNIQHAVIAIEDAHFYTHKGIRPTSILRAVIVNLTKGSFSQGGSTITQQIIKNTLLNTKKTVSRKFKEWVLAVKLERHFTKQQILQIYLNDAPFGSTIYGVEEASLAFFKKRAQDLTVGEAAYLAAMIPAPTYYSPFGKHRDALDERQDLVLKKMLSNGFITQEQYDTAQKEVVTFNIEASNSIKAPHFVFYILDYLEQKYGKEVMESEGFTIKTTLDYDLQTKAEAALKEYAASNKTKYNASNSALVAIDPSTGELLSMVGSRDYFDKEIDGAFNVATAPRQPGSSFKPFVYATAFAEGYTPETVLFDVPTEFSTACPPITEPATDDNKNENCYHPSNFDGKFKGPLSLRSSVAESRNIPSVKLLYLVGIDDALKTGRALGLSLGDRDQYGLSLVLGGGEVTLFDMVGAYGVFANAGVKNPTVGILEVVDKKGNIIEKYEPAPQEVFDRNAALMISDVLSDSIARTPTFGSSITIPGVAVKTGTTNDDRDAWIVGYTPTLAVGVWSGNNKNESMRSGGAAVSGPIWKKFMTEALEGKEVPAFEKPVPDPEYDSLKPILRGNWMGNRAVKIDSITGLLATEQTPKETQKEKVITDVHDILYWVDKDNPRGPVPQNPQKDPQFNLWEPSVLAWWEKNKGNYGVTTTNDIPSSYDTVHTTESSTEVTFSGLPSSFLISETPTVSFVFPDEVLITSAEIFVDDNYLTTLSSPFRFILNLKEYGYKPGSHVIKVVATDSVFNKHTGQKTVKISE